MEAQSYQACEVCNTKHTTFEALKKHKKTQLHKQNVLNVQLNTNSNIATEKNVHHESSEDYIDDDNIKLDQCVKCQKYFPNGNSLKYHMTTHDDKSNTGKNEMEAQSYEACMTQVDLLTLAIDRLQEEAKVKVVRHMQECLDLLKLGLLHLFSSDSDTAATTEDEEAESLLMENNSEGLEAAETIEELQNAEAVRMRYDGMVPTCTECDAKFLSLGALDTHMKKHEIHKQEVLDTSTESETKSRFSHQLKAQTTTNKTVPHNSEKSNSRKCEFCQKSFPTPSKLQRHQLVHSGAKPFSCTVCEKGFTQRVHLNSHKKLTHAQTMP